jgi:hypothetical protein
LLHIDFPVVMLIKIAAEFLCSGLRQRAQVRAYVLSLSPVTTGGAADRRLWFHDCL